MAKTIAHEQLQQLLGLFHLHAAAYREQQRIEASIASILDVPADSPGENYYGLVSDELSMQHPSVHNLLSRLEVDVAEPEDLSDLARAHQALHEHRMRQGYIEAHEKGGHQKLNLGPIEGCLLCEVTEANGEAG